MLHLPHVIIAEFISELDLGERILEQFVLAVLIPRPWQLVLVKNAEFHCRSLCLGDGRLYGADPQDGRRTVRERQARRGCRASFRVTEHRQNWKPSMPDTVPEAARE